MDVFKLLSKSAKASQNTSAKRLPSAGEASNPQLFGHDIPQSLQNENKADEKRKRSRDSEKGGATIPAELDFFGAAPHANPKNDAYARRTKSNGAQETNGEAIDVGSEDSGKRQASDFVRIREDECKRILRSHKLKITVLEDFAAQAEEAQSAEKKSKKRKRVKEVVHEPPSKKAKAQLYPQPLTAFRQLRERYGVSKRLEDNLEAQGYAIPTEVQLGGLPLLLEGQDSKSRASGSDIDLLTIAPTGSGKTIAFLVPVVNALLRENKDPKLDAQAPQAGGPRAIILAPTKELASQIVNEARKLAVGTGVKAALMKKGMEVMDRPENTESGNEDMATDEESEEHTRTGSHDEDLIEPPSPRQRRPEIVKSAILVSTPGALFNALNRRDGKTAKLPSVRYLVLDEADVLLDPVKFRDDSFSFLEQTLSIWNSCVNPALRVSLWSATMGSNVEQLAMSTLNSRWTSLQSTSTSLPSRAPLIRLVVGLKDTAIPNLTHKLVYAATEQGKLMALRQLLHPTATPSSDLTPSLRPPFLIFTQTIPRAIALHAELLYDIPPEAGGSSRIAVLHAGLPSAARDKVMTRFRRGEVWVLITTDLLARGVDFRGLNGVVNYDVPNSAAAYVHRVGRTGRAGREGGVAVTLYTKEDVPYVKNVANVIRASEKLLGKSEDEGEIKQWLLDALPTPSKRDKQRLKKRGVEARLPGAQGEGRTKTRISTKSGFERRMENNRREAVRGSKTREKHVKVVEDKDESDFAGFDD